MPARRVHSKGAQRSCSDANTAKVLQGPNRDLMKGSMPVMAQTSTQQRNAVSEGMALGLLLCGHSSLRYEKTGLDLAFAGAWRNWAYRQLFSQVTNDLSKGLDGVHAFTRADATKKTFALYWDHEGRDLKIRARQFDWNVDDAEDLAFAVSVIHDAVTAEGWRQLAEEFLGRFER